MVAMKRRFSIIAVTTVLILCVASQLALVSAAAAYQDEFDSTSLQSFWTFINPMGTSSYSLTAHSDYLRITAPQNSRLGSIPGGSNQNAPRMLQPVTDSFTASTYVTGSFSVPNYRAGLVVWKDSTNFIVIEKYGSNQVLMYSLIGGVEDIQTAGTSTGNSLHLKLIKTGTTISGSYSTDGSSWSYFAKIFTLSDPLQVGIFTFNGDASTATSSFSADFDYFRITPSSTMSVLPEYPVGVFGATAAIAGAYVFFKAKGRVKPVAF